MRAAAPATADAARPGRRRSRFPPGTAAARDGDRRGCAQPPLGRLAGRSLRPRRGRTARTRAPRASRAYLARLAAAQRAAAVAQLRRAIPAATRARSRYRIVLNGFAVELPARQLPALAALGFVAQVYPSVRYTLATEPQPDVIGADELSALRPALHGEGIKIGGRRRRHRPDEPVLRPAGLLVPAGFPKGGAKWTTPKVIVARSFPGPDSGRPGTAARSTRTRRSTARTSRASPPATRARTPRPAPTIRRRPGLSGVAPRAWIGNYRVFNVPTPIGHVANTPEIVAAFEAAVRRRDGRDQLLRRRPRDRAGRTTR